MKESHSSFIAIPAIVAVALLIFTGSMWNTAQATSSGTVTVNLPVGTGQTIIDCADYVYDVGSRSDSNPGIASESITDLECGPGAPWIVLSVNCLQPGNTILTIAGFRDPPPSNNAVPFTLTVNVTCTMFVLPESPVGAAALTSSSLGALGAFMLYRKHKAENIEP